MNDFSQKFNRIIAETYHNALLMEETKRKYSTASFSFRDRNAIAYLLRYEKGRTIGQLAEYLKISRPSATILVKKLEKRGLPGGDGGGGLRRVFRGGTGNSLPGISEAQRLLRGEYSCFRGEAQGCGEGPVAETGFARQQGLPLYGKCNVIGHMLQN